MDDRDRVVEIEIDRAEHAWMAALRQHDAAALERILADEFILQANGIGRMPRAQWLATQHLYEITENAFSDVRIRVYGETAVHQSRYRQQATFRGQDRSGEMYMTDVWVKRDGRWQVVARHTSFIAPDPA